MRPIPWFSPALLALVLPTLALAAGVSDRGLNLRWNNCYGDGGPQNRAFACDTNSGSELLHLSFVPASDVSNVIGYEFVLDLASASASLPRWWEISGTSVCRPLSLVAVSNVSATSPNCPAWSNGEGIVLVGHYEIGARGPNTVRIKGASSIPLPGRGFDFLRAHEYSAFQLIISHQNTVGAGACAGCGTPVCIVASSLKLLQQPVGSHLLTGPANLTDSDFATWQGGGAPVVGGVTGCPAATPTRSQTWGALKSLYR